MLILTSVPVSSPVAWARAAPAEAVILALVWATASCARSTGGALCAGAADRWRPALGRLAGICTRSSFEVLASLAPNP